MKLPQVIEGMPSRPLSKRQQFEQKTIAQWERYWKEPHSKTILERERLLRIKGFIEKKISFKAQDKWLDVGCGKGELALWLQQKEQQILASDAARGVLKYFKGDLSWKQSCLPYLSFEDDSFDFLLCTDVIAEIEEPLHRLAISELMRLLKREGYLICSTPLDLYSVNPITPFLKLLRTEFTLVDIQLSFHRLHFHLNRFFSAPRRFVKAAKNSEYRQKQLEKRKKWARFWFSWNSKKIFFPFWMGVKVLCDPFLFILNSSRNSLLFLEKVSEIFWGEGAATHITVIAKKRSFF